MIPELVIGSVTAITCCSFWLADRVHRRVAEQDGDNERARLLKDRDLWAKQATCIYPDVRRDAASALKGIDARLREIESAYPGGSGGNGGAP